MKLFDDELGEWIDEGEGFMEQESTNEYKYARDIKQAMEGEL
jgi:hypothetical protein